MTSSLANASPLLLKVDFLERCYWGNCYREQALVLSPTPPTPFFSAASLGEVSQAAAVTAENNTVSPSGLEPAIPLQ